MKLKHFIVSSMLCIGLFILFNLTAFAEEANGTFDNITWTLKDDTLTISCTKENTITDMKDWSPTSQPWKDYSSQIVNVIIDKGVYKLGAYSFYFYPNIETVTLENDMSIIGDCAFWGCSKLKTLTLGKNISTLSDLAFADCTKLEKIIWKASSVKDFTQDNRVFRNVGKDGPGVNVIFEYTAKKIPAYLFYTAKDSTYVSKIKDITIGYQVCSIGDYAFYNCGYLQNIIWQARMVNDFTNTNNVFYNAGTKAQGISVTFEQDVQKIPAYAFYNCDYLKKVTVADGVTSVGTHAFAYCDYMTEINWNAENVPDFTEDSAIFADCGLKGTGVSVTFGDSVKKVPSYIFHYRYADHCKITDVDFGDNITSIGEHAFYNCKDIKTVELGDNVKTIEDYAFGACRGMTYIDLPDNLDSIGHGAFSECRSLTSITIPESVTYVGPRAFSTCLALSSVYWNAISVADFEQFISNELNTPSLNKALVFNQAGDDVLGVDFVIGHKVERIPERFTDGANVYSLTVGENVKSIGYAAFDSLYNLRRIYWNAKDVTEIEYLSPTTYLFEGAGKNSTGIDVIIGNSVKIIPDNLFSRNSSYNLAPKICTFYVGYGVEDIGENSIDSSTEYEIYCYPFSCAKTYAEENGIEYHELDLVVDNYTVGENITFNTYGTPSKVTAGRIYVVQYDKNDAIVNALSYFAEINNEVSLPVIEDGYIRVFWWTEHGMKPLTCMKTFQS